MEEKKGEQNKYRKIVFVVVFRKVGNEIRYLILRRKLHWKGWEFPKGGFKENESAVRAIKREIKEETGQVPYYIKKYPERGKFLYKEPLRENNVIYTGSKYTLYSAQIKEGKVVIDQNEHSDYKWVDHKTAIKYLEWKNQRDAVKTVNDRLEIAFRLKPPEIAPPLKKKKTTTRNKGLVKGKSKNKSRNNNRDEIKTKRKIQNKKRLSKNSLKKKFSGKRKR